MGATVEPRRLARRPALPRRPGPSDRLAYRVEDPAAMTVTLAPQVSGTRRAPRSRRTRQRFEAHVRCLLRLAPVPEPTESSCQRPRPVHESRSNRAPRRALGRGADQSPLGRPGRGCDKVAGRVIATRGRPGPRQDRPREGVWTTSDPSPAPPTRLGGGDLRGRPRLEERNGRRRPAHRRPGPVARRPAGPGPLGAPGHPPGHRCRRHPSPAGQHAVDPGRPARRRREAGASEVAAAPATAPSRPRRTSSSRPPAPPRRRSTCRPSP